MDRCEKCDQDFRSIQGLRGHQGLVHGRARTNGNGAELAAIDDRLEAVELSGLLDRLVDRFSGPLGDQVRRQVEDVVSREVANLRRRVDALESRSGHMHVLAQFLKDDVLPAMERRLNGKKNEEPMVHVYSDEASMPPQWEPAPCGHNAPPGARTCDSLQCVAGRIKLQRGRE